VKTIYALIDPRDSKIKYIGQTGSPKTRLENHISSVRNSNDRSLRANWIRELLSEGLRPIFKELEVVPIDRANESETKYLNECYRKGVILCNRQDEDGYRPGHDMNFRNTEEFITVQQIADIYGITKEAVRKRITQFNFVSCGNTYLIKNDEKVKNFKVDRSKQHIRKYKTVI